MKSEDQKALFTAEFLRIIKNTKLSNDQFRAAVLRAGKKFNLSPRQLETYLNEIYETLGPK